MESDEEAFVRALYAEHAAPLTAYLTRLTGDRQRAEDLCQEALTRAWRHAPELTGTAGSLRAWLFAVARNLAVDEHRARRTRPGLLDAGEPPETAAADQLDRALEAWQIAEALGALSDDHRAVVIALYYQGRSVAEAGVMLGVPAGTIKSRAYYALRALRLELEERGWDA